MKKRKFAILIFLVLAIIITLYLFFVVSGISGYVTEACSKIKNLNLGLILLFIKSKNL